MEEFENKLNDYKKNPKAYENEDKNDENQENKGVKSKETKFEGKEI